MGKSIHDLREMLCEELENVTAQRGSLSTDKLKIIDMLTHSIKSIDTIIAMEEAGYSRDYSYRSYDSYEGRSNEGRSNEGRSNRSYARNRGRYSREEGYSGDDRLMQRLEEMLHESGSEKEREMIKRFMEQMR